MVAVLLILSFQSQVLASGRRALATHLPLWCLVRSVAPEDWEVGILIRPGTDVHSFSLRPGDVKDIGTAEVVFKSGAGLEKYLEKGFRSARKVVDASEGIEALRWGQGDPNPHIWLDPVLASNMVDNIAVYFKGDAAAQERAARLRSELNTVQLDAGRKLGPLKGKVLVTYHESFAYLARRYGLRDYSLTGPNSDTPLPSRMRELYDMAREGGLRAVFVEAGYPQDALRRMASELGLEVCTLENMTTGPMEPGYYIKGMRNNVDTIARCLAEVDGSKR